MTFALQQNISQFEPATHGQTVAAPATGPQQLFRTVNGIPVVLVGDTVGGNRLSNPFDYGIFPIIGSAFACVNGIPIASMNKSSAPPGFGRAITSGSQYFFAV